MAFLGPLDRFDEPLIKNCDREALTAEVPGGAETYRPGTDYRNGWAQLRASGITSE